MTIRSDDITQASALIRKDFGIESKDLHNHEIIDELHAQLVIVISYLLDKDFNRLLNAVYRIDISEQKLQKALSVDPPNMVAPSIATLILERELQKVETRKKYRP